MFGLFAGWGKASRRQVEELRAEIDGVDVRCAGLDDRMRKLEGRAGHEERQERAGARAAARGEMMKLLPQYLAAPADQKGSIIAKAMENPAVLEFLKEAVGI